MTHTHTHTHTQAFAWLRDSACLVFFGALVYVLYEPSLNAPMRSSDSAQWLADTAVRNSWATIFDPTLRSDNVFATTYYLPLQSALYAWMHAWFGRAPYAYHVLSLLIHSVNAWMVFVWLRDVLASRWAALASAWLFLAFAGHVQSVTWVPAAFSHPLVTMMMLACVLWFRAYLRAPRVGSLGVGSLGACFFFFALALLTRETAVVIPVVLACNERWLHPNQARPNQARPNQARPNQARPWTLVAPTYVCMLLMCLPILAITAYKLPRGTLSQDWGGVAGGWFPLLRFVDFGSTYLYPLHAPKAWRMAWMCLFGLLGCGVWLRAPRRPRWFAAWVCVVVLLAPYCVSNFNPTLHVMRYVYPASVGMALLFGLLLRDTEAWLKASRRPLSRLRYATMLAAFVPAMLHVVITYNKTHGG